MSTENQIAVIPAAELQALAQDAHKSGLFGLTNPSQAAVLFAICAAEGLHPVAALKRYYIIENKPSMRADAMLAEFLARGGGVMWHVRTDKTVAATFFADSKKMDQAAVERSKVRFEAIIQGDEKTIFEQANPGEDTIIRTIEDATAKGTCMSWKDGKQTMKHVWKANPRQMLTARVITEGVRLIAPGVVAGIYAPEELEDSKAAFLQDAGQAPDRDLAAMQTILHQHEHDALVSLNAGNDREAKRFQGLAADTRILIQEKCDKMIQDEKVASAVVQAPTASPKTAVMELANAAKTDSVPNGSKSVEPADDVPMKHAADLPKDCKLIKGSEIPQPKPKESAAPSEGTAVPPTEVKQPESQQSSDWKIHKIEHVKSSAYKGRPLSSLSRDEREVLWRKRGEPFLASEDPSLRHEAQMIKLAWEATKSDK